MDNFSNIDKSKLWQMLKDSALNQGINADKINSALSKGDLNTLMGSLNKNQSDNIKKILNDKEALQKLLNSPAAKKLLGEMQK